MAKLLQDSDLLSLGLGPEHVKRLHDELARLLEQAEKGAGRNFPFGLDKSSDPAAPTRHLTRVLESSRRRVRML